MLQYIRLFISFQDTFLDLYEKFIERKYDVFFKEKTGIEGESSYIKNKLTKALNKDHQRLAFHKLFSKLEQTKILADERKLLSQEEEKDLKLAGIIQSTSSKGEPDFIHQTFAEYFAAGLLVDMIRRREDSSKYKLVHEFLLTQIFRDRNKVIRDFIKDNVEKENNQNLKNKWKAIQDCDLLKETKLRYEFSYNKQSSALSKKNLDALLEELRNEMPQGYYKKTGKDGYFYSRKDEKKNIDKSLVEDFFSAFFEEKNIEELKKALKFLLDIKEKGLHLYNNHPVPRIFKEKFSNAIYYYRHEARQQGKQDSEFEKEIDELEHNTGKKKLIEDFDKLLYDFINNRDHDKKRDCVEELANFLIPKTRKDLIVSNALLRNNKDTIKKILSYINSKKEVQKTYKDNIVNSLKNIDVHMDGDTAQMLNPLEYEDHLQSFFISITHHSNIIEDTKSDLNEIYENMDNGWLERQGVVISRFLKILTLEMSEAFIGALNGSSGIGAFYNSKQIFNNLIYHILRSEIEKMDQISKRAFLKMITHFTKENPQPQTSKQLETILKLIETVLNKQDLDKNEVSESLEYLFLLGKKGLKLINADKILIMLDPASEFQYELSSGYKDQIVELVKWKKENPNHSEDDFIKKFNEVIKSKENNLKRTGSQGHLQQSPKRSKIEQYNEQQKAFVRLGKFIGSNFPEVEVKAVKQGLYMPSFESLNVKIDGKCAAITRIFSQGLFLEQQVHESFLTNLQTSAEVSVQTCGLRDNG